MDDDVVRIAVGVRLGVAICHPHQCRSCGADVDSLRTHGLSCRFSSGRHCRHAAVNDIVKRSLDSARIRVILNHQACSDQMAGGPTELQLYRGRKGRF